MCCRGRYAARRRLNLIRAHIAATVVQQLVRRTRARLELQRRQRYRAAVAVQKMWRGKMGRRAFRRMLRTRSAQVRVCQINGAENGSHSKCAAALGS